MVSILEGAEVVGIVGPRRVYQPCEGQRQAQKRAVGGGSPRERIRGRRVQCPAFQSDRLYVGKSVKRRLKGQQSAGIHGTRERVSRRVGAHVLGGHVRSARSVRHQQKDDAGRRSTK